MISGHTVLPFHWTFLSAGASRNWAVKQIRVELNWFSCCWSSRNPIQFAVQPEKCFYRHKEGQHRCENEQLTAEGEPSFSAPLLSYRDLIVKLWYYSTWNSAYKLTYWQARLANIIRLLTAHKMYKEDQKHLKCWNDLSIVPNHSSQTQIDIFYAHSKVKSIWRNKRDLKRHSLRV